MSKGKKTGKGNATGWSEQHLKDLQAAGYIRGYTVIGGGRQPGAPPPTGAPGPTAPAPDPAPAPERDHKFGAKPTEVDGIKFPSLKEAKRWRDLKLLELAGRIDELRRQVPYELNPGGAFSYRYFADFVYRDTVTGETIVEDAKGERTKVYKKKARLMLKIHGIKILET